jgi:N-acetylmuramoyl-L-alanine amidase
VARPGGSLLGAALALVVLVVPVGASAGDPPVDVALDPGHSRADIGASGYGLAEYRLTLDLAQRVESRLEDAHLSVRLTRHDDTPLTPITRPGDEDEIRIEQTARIEAGLPARVYVSLHFNGGPIGQHGTETYYNPSRGDGSGADWALAAALQRHVVAALADAGVATLDRGAKSDLAAGKPYGHFFSLRGPVPSALVESLFLSNPDDAAAIKDPATLDALATGCAQGILEYLAGGAPDSG